MDQIGPKLDHKGLKIVVLRGFFCRNFVCRIWAFEEIILHYISAWEEAKQFLLPCIP